MSIHISIVTVRFLYRCFVVVVVVAVVIIIVVCTDGGADTFFVNAREMSEISELLGN